MLKYLELFNEIKSKILSGTYKASSILPTEMDLVGQYKVSRTTVQKALDLLVKEGFIVRYPGKGSFVAENQQQYTENITPAGVNKTFALLLPNKRQTMFNVMTGTQKYLENSGCELIINFNNYNDSDEVSIVANLIKRKVDGVILYPLHTSDMVYKQLVENNIAVVTIDKQINRIPTNNVSTNDYEGGYTAARFLIQCGHRDITLFTTPISGMSTLTARLNGFCDCLKDNGIAINKDRFYILSNWNSSEYDDITRYFKRSRLPDAIFCSCDEVAARAYKVMHDLNISIPGDVSMIGYDNLEFTEFIAPPLTTIEQPYFSIGEHAARILLGIFDSPGSTISRILLPPKLIVRNSVKVVTA